MAACRWWWLLLLLLLLLAAAAESFGKGVVTGDCVSVVPLACASDLE